jgi:hypothetical protein
MEPPPHHSPMMRDARPGWRRGRSRGRRGAPAGRPGRRLACQPRSRPAAPSSWPRFLYHSCLSSRRRGLGNGVLPFPMQILMPSPLTPATCACSRVMVLLSSSPQCLHAQVMLGSSPAWGCRALPPCAWPWLRRRGAPRRAPLLARGFRAAQDTEFGVRWRRLARSLEAVGPLDLVRRSGPHRRIYAPSTAVYTRSRPLRRPRQT